MTKPANKYSPEVRERAVRMVLDGAGQHESRWAAIISISSKISCAPQTLNEWVKKVLVDTGQRGGVTSEQAEKIKALEREVRELKQANEILRKASTYFAPTLTHASMFCRAAGRSSTAHCNDDPVHRADHGVEPICRVLPIAPATFYDHLTRRADPSRFSNRAQRDAVLKPEIEIERVYEENLSVYGVRKVWHQTITLTINIR
ncbi:MAG: transposase [Paracoccaceae bacterium]